MYIQDKSLDTDFTTTKYEIIRSLQTSLINYGITKVAISYFLTVFRE